MSSANETRAEEFLSRAPLFARLESRQLHRLAEICVPRSYETGEEIVVEGSTGLGLFVITGGRVEVSRGTGEEKVVFAELGSGDLLGEMSLVDDQPRSATVRTLEPTTCLLITRGSFQSLVDREPEIAWCIVPVLAGRLRALQEELIAGGSGAQVGAVVEDVTWSEDDGDTKDSQGARAALSLLRGQYGLALAMAGGMRGFAEAAESFLRNLARDTDLEDSEDLADVVRESPRGLVDATEECLADIERLPERMLARYRRARGGRRRK
jgi:CRP/FNR family cyclic AMP-dependent transcriptional regulator